MNNPQEQGMNNPQEQGQEMVPLISSNQNNNYNTISNSNNTSYTQASRFGIPMESYKQGFLNVIARYNTSSQSSNLAKSAYARLRGRQPDSQQDQMSDIREQRIRAALQSVIDMPQGTLGNFSGAQAFSSIATNYGNWAGVGKQTQQAASFLGNTRRKWFGMGGKKTRRNKKSRKHRKHRKH
jgi:hypothetical protein